MELRCHYCHVDLQNWNTGAEVMRYCPACGRKLHKATADALWRSCLDEEIADMVEEHVLEMLDNYDMPDAGEIDFLAWECENTDGVVFYSNLKADRFAIRHSVWVSESLTAMIDRFGDDSRYAGDMAECMDRFLVSAFICATGYYLYSQLGIDNSEGCLTKERREELKRLIKENRYDGNF